MALDGVSEEDQMRVFEPSSSQAVTSKPTQTPASAPTPAPAPLPTPAPTPMDAAAATATELPAALKKFSLMIKHGVPPAAVKAKMALEGVSEEDQAMVLSASSASAAPTAAPALQPECTPAAPSSTTAVFPASLSAPASKKRAAENTPKMLGLHWEPLAQGNLQETLWGQNASSEPVSLEKNEFDKLALLFGRKEDKKAGVTSAASTTAATGASSKQSAKSKQPQHIDATRGMNVAIALAAFKGKQMGVDDISLAVSKMSIDKLGLDGVLRIREILPTEAEAKTLKAVAGRSAESIDSLHDAEKILFKLSTIANARARVDAMLFLGNAQAASHGLVQSLGVLKLSSTAALSSEGLAVCLKAVLAIGNAMNAGTFKGDQNGFRLSSLSKLQATRSSDGTCNLVDYLVQVLTTRARGVGDQPGGDAAAEAGIKLPETLGHLRDAKALSLQDLLRDASGLSRDCQSAARAIDMVANEGESAVVPRLRELLAQAEGATSAAAAAAAETKSACGKLAQYFGEGPERAGECIAVIADFIDAVSVARAKFLAAETKKRKADQAAEMKSKAKK